MSLKTHIGYSHETLASVAFVVMISSLNIGMIMLAVHAATFLWTAGYRMFVEHSALVSLLMRASGL